MAWQAYCFQIILWRGRSLLCEDVNDTTQSDRVVVDRDRNPDRASSEVCWYTRCWRNPSGENTSGGGKDRAWLVFVTGVKRRPAVVMSSAAYHATRPDMIVGLITTEIFSVANAA